MKIKYLYLPCAILLCGCDNTVVDRHGPLDRLADWYHHLLLVLLLHHLLIFVSHRHLGKQLRQDTVFRKKSNKYVNSSGTDKHTAAEQVIHWRSLIYNNIQGSYYFIIFNLKDSHFLPTCYPTVNTTPSKKKDPPGLISFSFS